MSHTSAATAMPTQGYETINEEELARIRTRHAWIVQPISRASEIVKELPFFDWVRQIRTPMDFKPAAINLFHHSATFPKVMGLMLGSTPLSENFMMPFYAKHAFEEATHHELLMQWMLKHGVMRNRQEMDWVIPTPETNACVNVAYQLAVEQDRGKWLVTINSGIERCSNDFFKAVAPQMHSIGAGDIYFDIHVEADEHHSIMGMDHIEPEDPDSIRGRQLIAKALEGISLWTAMLHSWIGIDLFPKFELDGTLKRLDASVLG